MLSGWNAEEALPDTIFIIKSRYLSVLVKCTNHRLALDLCEIVCVGAQRTQAAIAA